MTNQPVDLSDAVVLFLKDFPSKNEEEFLATFDAEDTRAAVQTILEETSKIRIEWGDKTLVDIGREVREVMHERHPVLSEAALKKLGNYYTYLVK